MKKKLIVSLAALGFLAMLISPLAAQDEPGSPPDRPFGSGARMARWLELTPEQEAKLKDMRETRREANKGVFEKLDKMRRELGKALQDPQSDQKKIEGLVDEIHLLKAAQMKDGFKFRKEMEKVLTPAQLEKLKKAKGRMEEMRDYGRSMRRHQGRRMMMRPGGFGTRGARNPWHRGFGPGWDW
ncbi:MAG: periplasmic heavy metal sensor [Candidatus Aminicenantes bacterium]|nr:periplasmic heavy metal sensor [Candidatus Aminicenantes bacterium]